MTTQQSFSHYMKNNIKRIDKDVDNLSQRLSVVSATLTDTINGQTLVNNHNLNIMGDMRIELDNQIRNVNIDLSYYTKIFVLICVCIFCMCMLSDSIVTKRINNLEKQIEEMKGNIQNPNVEQYKLETERK